MMCLFFFSFDFGYRRFLKIDDLLTKYVSEIQYGLPVQLISPLIPASLLFRNQAPIRIFNSGIRQSTI